MGFVYFSVDMENKTINWLELVGTRPKESSRGVYQFQTNRIRFVVPSESLLLECSAKLKKKNQDSMR